MGSGTHVSGFPVSSIFLGLPHLPGIMELQSCSAAPQPCDRKSHQELEMPPRTGHLRPCEIAGDQAQGDGMQGKYPTHYAISLAPIPA